jgi:HPt (histidine-containing phosphotransfer) domain-containing protein
MQTMQSAASLFDPEVVLDRVGGDEELLREITEIFLSESPELLDEIRAAVQSEDASRLERSAHTLKGAVSNFGAQAATQAALHLETLGRRRDLRDASAALRSLELQFAALTPALEHFAHSVVR